MTHSPFPLTHVTLSTGVELDVAIEGPEDGEPIIFLHGFPESHRTWQHQIARFSGRYRCIAPDQRGYAGSSKPKGVDAYKIQHLVADVIALADVLDIGQFTLVGHDWGAGVAWATALGHANRVKRLIIANGPHPFTYQKSLFDDLEQRAAAQYITAFRGDGFLDYVYRKGWDAYFDENFANFGAAGIEPEERAIYLKQWATPGAFEAMINWYRASQIIIPPLPSESGPSENGSDSANPMPERPAYLDNPFPILKMPTLLIWAMDDHALRPSLLDGLDDLIEDLALVKIPGGHFVTWENHEEVNVAIEDWL